MTGRFLTGDRQAQVGRRPWYRLRRYRFGIVAVVVLLAVVADRYDNYTPTDQIHQLRSLYASVTSDLSACVGGTTLATRAWSALGPGPTRAAADHAAALASEAEVNCTPVSDDGGVYDLANMQVPGALTKVHRLSLALYDLTEWAYPEAAQALLDLKTLDHHPADRATRAALARSAAKMRSDARTADGILSAAARRYGIHLRLERLPVP